MTELDSAQIKVVVDVILARTRLPLSPGEYERLLGLYPQLQIQCAALRIPELRDLEPATTYQAQPTR